MSERPRQPIVKVHLVDIMRASESARVVEVPEIVDEYGRPVTPHGKDPSIRDKASDYGRILRPVGLAAAALVAFGVVLRLTGGSEQITPDADRAAQGSIGTGTAATGSLAETDGNDGVECVANASSYELEGTDWHPVAKISANGWTPMYMDFERYKVTNPTSILARFAGDVHILAKIDPDGLQVDDAATKSSGIYTIDIDPKKIQYKTDLTELQSGPSALDETVVFEQLTEQYDATGDESVPKPTMEDAQNLVALVRGAKGDIEAYNIGLLKTLSQEMYGTQIPQESVAVLGQALRDNATSEQCIASDDILFKFSGEPPVLDLEPREFGDTEQIDFVTEDFSANIVGIGASGKQLENEETAQ